MSCKLMTAVVYNLMNTTITWENLFTLIGISLFTYVLAVQLPLLNGQHGRTEEILCSHE